MPAPGTVPIRPADLKQCDMLLLAPSLSLHPLLLQCAFIKPLLEAIFWARARCHSQCL